MVEAHTKGPIELIEFIGRQHGFLTNITDELNVCYGFQVRVNCWLIFAVWIIEWFHKKYFFWKDFGQHWIIIHVGRPNNLRILQRWNCICFNAMRSNGLADTAYQHRSGDHLLQQLIDQWSNNYDYANKISIVASDGGLFALRAREQLELYTTYAIAFMIQT